MFQKTQSLNTFRSPAISVAFYRNVIHLPKLNQLKKNPKTHLCFNKNPKFERSEKSYLFRMHSISTLFPLAFYKIFMIYFWKSMYFFHEKQTLHVLRNYTISFAFYGKLATFSKFMNNQLSYQKTFSFWEKTQILKVLRSFINSVEFYRLIGTFTGIKKIKFFLQNSIFFKKTNDERFEKSYYFKRILRQFCYH